MLGHQTSVLKGAPSPSGPVFESVSSELFGRFAACAVKSLFATSLWLTVLSPLLWMLLRKPSRGIGLALKVTYANWIRETSARHGGVDVILSSRWPSSTRLGRGQPSSAMLLDRGTTDSFSSSLTRISQYHSPLNQLQPTFPTTFSASALCFPQPRPHLQTSPGVGLGLGRGAPVPGSPEIGLLRWAHRFMRWLGHRAFLELVFSFLRTKRSLRTPLLEVSLLVKLL